MKKTFEEFIRGFEDRYTPEQLVIMKAAWVVGEAPDDDDTQFLIDWMIRLGTMNKQGELK